MKRKWIALVLVLGLLVAYGSSARAGFVEAEDVQAVDGDPSPGQRESRINNYINQDEQLNLNSKDGVVRVLRTDQKILVNDFVSEVYRLRYANPRELRKADVRRLGDRKLGNQVAGLRSECVCTDDATGRRIADDLHEAETVAVDGRGAGGGERKLSNSYRDPCLESLCLGQTNRRNLR